VGVEAGGYFAYGLYDDCIYQEGLRSAQRVAWEQGLRTLPREGDSAFPAGAVHRRSTRQKALSPAMARLLGFSKAGIVSPTVNGAVNGHGGSSAVNGAVNDYVCGGGDAQTAWTNAPAVRKSLHVPLDALFFNGDNGERGMSGWG
jgi:hypothetical protein